MAIRGAAHIYAAQQAVAAKQALASPTPLAYPNAPIHTLNEADSKSLLEQFGIPTPKRAVATGENAVETAVSLGFPVVVKVLSSDIVHKSDVGGVVVNVRDEVGVKTAVSAMSHLSNQFLIEQMATKPIVEMILGLTRDPQFGLALVIGAGGILVELFQDSQTLLLPTSRAEVESALAKLKIAPLLDGYRGQAGVDKAGLVTAVLNLARFAEAHADRLIEVDVNPLFVYEGGLTAVDAVVRLR